MLEITVDEEVVLSPLRRAVLHDYGEPFQVEILVYTLEEIAAEKLRAILQYVERLQRRGWSRSRARDYYDLWRIFCAYRGRLNLGGFVELLEAKCAVRDVSFNSVGDFFHPVVLAHVERTWQDWLGPLVAGLPPFPKVIGELEEHLRPLLGAP